VLLRDCEPVGESLTLEPRVFGGKPATTEQKPPESGDSTGYQPSRLSQSHSAQYHRDEEANVDDKNDITTEFKNLLI
jgi:hypothetical protein